MNNTRLLVVFIGGLTCSGMLSLLLGQTPFAGVEQQLRSQYRVAMVGSDSISVIGAGAVLVVAQNGIKASPPSAFGCWYNSHKPGSGIKYSVVSEALTPVDLKNQMRLLQVGEKVVVIRLDVKPSEVDFCVQTYTDNPNDPPYRAGVMFQFQQKNYVQAANLKAIQDSIAEVFTLDTTTPTEGSGPAPGETTTSEPKAPSTRLEQVAGLYVLRQAPDNRLQLNADGTFLLVQLGKNYSGTFTVDANKLIIHQAGVRKPQQSGTIQGDTLTDPQNSVWVKQKTAAGAVQTPQLEQVAGLYVRPQAANDRLQLNIDGTFSQVQAGGTFSGTFTIEGNKLMARIGNRALPASTLQGDTIFDPDGTTWVKRKAEPAVPLPTTAPLRLPSTYVSVQTPADQLQLNADNSFSLQEGGQTYHGTFVANGSAVELNISDTNTKTTATIQGNSLTDGSGQAWVLREQSAGTAPSGPLLLNEDIIKMVKAGLDEAIIIAKIGGSKCQFDTSTDALIQLKGSGVSAAVLKAMVGAGR
jgi:hypothetical protein